VRTLLNISLFLFCVPAFAQFDSIWNPGGVNGKGLHERSGERFAQTEKSIGIVPEINFLTNYSFALGLSRANFIFGEGAASGYGINCGLSYSPTDKLSIPYASIWFSGNAFMFFGFYGGLKALYYTNGKNGNMTIRPEIGFGLVKLNIFYGYNLFLNSEIANVSRHSLTISYYQTIYPGKKKKK
jgi:hypothetical protein